MTLAKQSSSKLPVMGVITTEQLNSKSCISVRTRGGLYGKLWPEPEGNPEGSGHILPYILT